MPSRGFARRFPTKKGTYMSDIKNILVTGGAGFIGSHTCVELLQAGYGVVIIDDLSNSCEKAVNRIAQIVKQAEADGKAPAGASERMKFYEDNIYNLLNITEELLTLLLLREPSLFTFAALF